MTPKEIATKTNSPLWKVYYVAKRLGRLPTQEELEKWEMKRGRPPKKWKTRGEI